MKKDKKAKKKKPQVVYLEDKGDTIYSMSALHGRTPEEQEAFDEKRKNNVAYSRGEQWAMIKAAFQVYGPILLILVGSFLLTAIGLYFFLKY